MMLCYAGERRGEFLLARLLCKWLVVACEKEADILTGLVSRLLQVARGRGGDGGRRGHRRR